MKNEKGVIIILTLVVMAVLLSIAISFAVFIMSDLRQSKEIDDSLLAYYSADAGMERALFLMRKAGLERVGNKTTANTLLNLVHKDSDKITLDNNATWDILASTDYEELVLRQRLYNGQNLKFYFLGRSNTPPINNVKSIAIDWHKGHQPSGVRMQMTMTQLNPQQDSAGHIVYYSDQNMVDAFDSDSPSYKPCKKFLDAEIDGHTGFNPPYDYLVEIKALGGPNDFIEDLNITAYDTNDCTGAFDTQAITNATIVATGYYGPRSQKTIVAHLPPRDVLSGVLGFVLFTETDITKGY